MQILLFILAIGAAQGIFLAILLAARKTNSNANRVLAVAMTGIAIFLLEAIYYGNQWYLDTTAFIGISEPLIFMFGPILYLYTLIIMRGGQEFRTEYLWHFLPAALVLLYDTHIYFADSATKLAFIQRVIAADPPLAQTIIDYAKHLSGCIYTAVTLRLLFKHARQIRDTHSSIEKINLRWLRNLNFGLAAVWLFALVNFILFQLQIHPQDTPLSLTPFGVAIFVYAIGYLGLRQPEIFHTRPGDKTEIHVLRQHREHRPVMPSGRSTPPDLQADQTQEPKANNSLDYKHRQADDQKSDAQPWDYEYANPNVATAKPTKAAAYRKSGLDETRAHAILQELTDYMQAHKAWRRNDLTLLQLARALDVKPHNLTEVINTQLGKNFYDYVNSHRVEDVKQGLWNPANDHLTILALAYDAGFNAKSTFNTIFKKQTGFTPSQYRRLRDQEIQS